MTTKKKRKKGSRKNVIFAQESYHHKMKDIAELHNKACDLPLGNETLLVICREIVITFFFSYVLQFSFQAETVTLKTKFIAL